MSVSIENVKQWHEAGLLIMEHKARLDNEVSNKFGSPSFLILYYGFANPNINNSTIKEALEQMAIAATDVSSSHPIKVASSTFISISKIAYRSENIKEFRYLLTTKGWLPIDLEAEERAEEDARKEAEERKRKAEEDARKEKEERKRKAEEDAREEERKRKAEEDARKEKEERTRKVEEDAFRWIEYTNMLIKEVERQRKRAKTKEKINNILYKFIKFILRPLYMLVAIAALFGLYKGIIYLTSI